MSNPLTTLDELIWKQFEKVTVAAEKRLGWDKWDLAIGTLGVAAGSFAGTGVYLSIQEIIFSGYNSLPITAIPFIAGVAGYEAGRMFLQRARAREEKLVEQGVAPFQPQFNPFRPGGLALGAAATLYGIFTLKYGQPETPAKYATNSQAFNTINGLITILAGTYGISLFSSYYFITQLPRPPSPAKKSLWHALAGYITKPFHKEQQPVEVPVSKYVAEQKALLTDYLKPQA